jgi:hypothetical protein
MAEGLALAASIFAVIQITDRVVSLCCSSMGKVRGTEKEAIQMVNSVTGLKGFLDFLGTFVKVDENVPRLPLLNSLHDPGGPLDKCSSTLLELEAKIHPKLDRSGILKPIIWWNEITEILKDIELQKTYMMLAMQGDTTRAALKIENTVTSIHSMLQDTNHKDILTWLTKCDPTSNHDSMWKTRTRNRRMVPIISRIHSLAVAWTVVVVARNLGCRKDCIVFNNY